MNEKKFTYILFAVAFIAILVVVLVSIPWGGEKANIAKEYESLEGKDHVFERINYDEVIKNIENGETFQVYIGSNNLPHVEQFVYETNKLAKEYKIDTIYYLKFDELTEAQITNLKLESDLSVTFPTLIYWENDEETSTAFHISSLKNFERDYQSNWLILLSEYFNDCYE